MAHDIDPGRRFSSTVARAPSAVDPSFQHGISAQHAASASRVADVFSGFSSRLATSRRRTGRTQSTTSTEGLLATLSRDLRSGAPTSTTKATTTVKQLPSPELEARFSQFEETLKELAGGAQEAFGAKEATFDNLIAELSNIFGQRESAAGAGAQTAALASGFTPLEATGAGQEASLDILNQFFPQLAQLQTGQADVGIALQEALQGITQGIELPFIGDVLTPFLRDVAGQTQTTTGETTDTLARQGLLANLLRSTEGAGALGAGAAPAQPGDLIRRILEASGGGMAGGGGFAGAAPAQQGISTQERIALMKETGMGERLTQKLDMDQILAALKQQSAVGEREAGREFTTSERLAGEKFTGGQNLMEALIKQLTVRSGQAFTTSEREAGEETTRERDLLRAGVQLQKGAKEKSPLLRIIDFMRGVPGLSTSPLGQLAAILKFMSERTGTVAPPSPAGQSTTDQDAAIARSVLQGG